MVVTPTRAISWTKADYSLAQALRHWSKLVDDIVAFSLKSGPIAWRSELSHPWQPLGTSTLVRIIQNLSVPYSSNTWVELQDTNHTVLRFDARDTLIREQFNREVQLRLFPQSKARASGKWTGRNYEPNRMTLRIPHR